MAEDQHSRIDSMTNVELRAELKRRGCSTTGNKKDLIAKLRIALQKEHEKLSLGNSIEHSQTDTSITNTTLSADHQIPHEHSSACTDSNIPQHISSSSISSVSTSQEFSMSSSADNQQYSSVDSSKKHSTTTAFTSFEKEMQTHEKDSSVDNLSSKNSSTTLNQSETKHEATVLDLSASSSSTEVNSLVCKILENEQRNIEMIESGACLTPIANNSTESESIVKAISLSDEQQHFEQANREQVDLKNVSLNEEQDSTPNIIRVEDRKVHEPIAQSSNNLLTIQIERQESSKDGEESSITKSGNITATQPHLQAKRSQATPFLKGFHRSTHNKINLSLELLKTLISDVSLLPESASAVDLDEYINEHNLKNAIEQGSDVNVNHFLPYEPMTIGELADQHSHITRTVVMNVAVSSSSRNIDHSTRKRHHETSEEMISTESKSAIGDKKKLNISDEPIRIKDVTVSRGSTSQILYIQGLTRPFSLQQLKQLLRRYGTLKDDKFWLDKIKSQCLATYNTIEEAQITREALDGCRWPSTNPRTLSIRFAQENELEFSLKHDLPPDEMSIDEIDRMVKDRSNSMSSPQPISPEDHPVSNKNKKHLNEPTTNTSDIQKEKHSEFLIMEDVEETSVSRSPSPEKGLDDYFHKTKARPSIYWLPLTEEQALERMIWKEQNNDRNRRRKRHDENAWVSYSESDRRSTSPERTRKWNNRKR